MTFLKKLGQILAQGIAIATGFGPLIAPYFGSKAGAVANTVINDLTAIGGVVVQTEAILQGSGRGADKLKAAVPLIINIVKTSELMSGHKIADETLFLQGCTDLTNGVAEILNSLSAKNIPVEGDPLPAIPEPKSVPVATPPWSGANQPEATKS